VIVLDSSFLIAFHNSRDIHHDRASGVMERLVDGEWQGALLLEYVFLEVMTVLLARRGLATATAVGEALLQAREVEFVPGSELFVDTFHTFRTQRSRALSFTDAAIVTVARQRGTQYVATFDTDFRNLEGIEVVP